MKVKSSKKKTSIREFYGRLTLVYATCILSRKPEYEEALYYQSLIRPIMEHAMYDPTAVDFENKGELNEVLILKAPYQSSPLRIYKMNSHEVQYNNLRGYFLAANGCAKGDIYVENSSSTSAEREFNNSIRDGIKAITSSNSTARKPIITLRL